MTNEVSGKITEATSKAAGGWDRGKRCLKSALAAPWVVWACRPRLTSKAYRAHRRETGDQAGAKLNGGKAAPAVAAKPAAAKPAADNLIQAPLRA